MSGGRPLSGRPVLLALTVWAVVQAVTGWLLAVYFDPRPEEAVASLHVIQSLVAGGWFVRAMHHVGASLLVAGVLVYMVILLWRGTYGWASRWTWWTALGVAGCVLAGGFTGYLLPWDERAYWATRVGLELLGLLPGVGPVLLDLVRGGPAYGAATLQRLYVLHAMIVPVATAALLAWHWRARAARLPDPEAVQVRLRRL